MKKIICLMASCFILHVAADPREDSVEAIMEAQGLFPMLQQHVDQGVAEGKKIAGRMMVDLAGKVSPSAEYKMKFDEAYNHFVVRLRESVSRKDILADWTTAYGSQFSLEELQKIADFYTSDLGKKHLQANQASLEKFGASMEARIKPLYQKATEDFISEIKKVADECECPKQK